MYISTAAATVCVDAQEIQRNGVSNYHEKW